MIAEHADRTDQTGNRPGPAAGPDPAALLTLLKPVTWFPPVWAYLCGIVAAGAWPAGATGLVLLGALLAGPVVCGMSQAVNDWADRHVDAINEPHRPIPSGRVGAPTALALALILSVAAILLARALGPWGFGATALAVAAAWAYSVEPLRLKRSALWGPGLVALCYEGLPWITGAAIIAGGAPRFEVLAIALLYAAGAHGIMTINDFKAVEGDRAMGIRSLPVIKGPVVAARIAGTTMIVPQLVVATLVLLWGAPVSALAILALVAAQIAALRALVRDPVARAPWFNGTGVLAYVTGMMIAAIALSGLGTPA